MNFKAEQQRLYSLLNERVRCFVRVCDGGNALWVSDFPRRCAETAGTAELLKRNGFSVLTDGQLWLIDWTEEYWQELLDAIPESLPRLPDEQERHEAYALCRLLLVHPAQRQTEHMPALRTAVKLSVGQTAHAGKAIRDLYEEAAVQLRQGKTVAHDAGRILAVWLRTLEDGKEKQQ